MTTGKVTEWTALCTWVKTHTRSPDLRNGLRSKCWPAIVWKPSSRKITASRQRPSSPEPSSYITGARKDHLADGIVITPSHNPPRDGGFKYNPPNGGPADTEVTQWVEARANELLRTGNVGVNRVPFSTAIKAATIHEQDFVLPYVNDLRNVVDMDVIRAAGIKLGVDPLGGAAKPYWEPIISVYGLNIDVTNPEIDPTFSFMTVDHDGVIRMDCSSPVCNGAPGQPQGQVSPCFR